ncbi:SDR family oxidoreductase [Paractinoplanes hotanensis]|uniref:SDR family oxidoreductase n=1 Tax=Paractinoplanes hotanensis TaxID=2906497 RepID=A0ABT0XSV5_9ACTN|nr:SDR family oxidoreductase [Actinoplanes hotanensis]MCM4076852.1 SDR family oxidoreductase [Actinoplanes hotanensis]
MTLLTNRIAVVTGASSGIGAATITTLVAEGAKVAALARRADRLEELDALALPADVRDYAAVTAAAGRIHAELGRPDLVVANAGVMLAAAFDKADLGEWDQMIGTNLTGLLNTARVFTDDLIAAAAEGRPADLFLIGSVASHMVYPTYAVYGATKAAVAHLARHLRAELGSQGVRVHNIDPGLVRSELGEGMLDTSSRQAWTALRDSMDPLEGADIGAGIAFAAAAPARMNVADMVIVPTGQG